MSHSNDSRESSGSPSRKRSRSPASDHASDSPSPKRRSPSPRQDSAGASPSNGSALPPRLISRRATRSPRRTPPSTRRHRHVPLPSLSPDNALGLNAPDHSLGASAQAGLPSPPSHMSAYRADPEHDEPSILLYPNEEPQAYPPDEPATYPEDEAPYYPPALRSPSSSSARFAFRNPSPVPRDPSPAPRVPPQGPFIAPPLPGSPRFALDAYTFGQPSRGPILPEPVSPRSRTPPVPSSARRGGSSDGRRVVPPQDARRVVPSQDPRRGIVPSNAPYTPFYPSPSSGAPEPYTRSPGPYTRSPEPYLYSLAGHNAPTVPSQASHHSQWPEDSGYDAPPHASTSYAHASMSYARAATSYAPASTYDAPRAGPSHYTPQSPQASTSRLPELSPADWIPRPPRSPRPEHPVHPQRAEHPAYPPQRPVEDYLLPPLRRDEPVASTSRYLGCSASCTRLVERLEQAVDDWNRALPVVPEMIQGHGSDCPFRDLYIQAIQQSKRWQERHDAVSSDLQTARRQRADAEELAEYRRLQIVVLEQRERGHEAAMRELKQRLRESQERERQTQEWAQARERETAGQLAAAIAGLEDAARRQDADRERQQDLLRANRCMARQLHAHGLIPMIEQVDESGSEDEVVTPGGLNSQAEDVTIVEPNTVVDGFTPIEEFDPVDEALEAEDDLDYADDFDADEFEVTTPVQANITVQAFTPVEATTPVEAATPVEATTPVQRSPALAPSPSTPNLPPAPSPSPAEGPAPRSSESPVPAPSHSAHASASPRASPEPASQRSSPRLASRRSSPRHASPRPSPRLASPYARPASASSQRSPSPAESSSSRIYRRPFASSMLSVAPHAMRRRLGAPIFQADAAEGRAEEQDEDEPAIKVEPEDGDQPVVKLEPEEETLPSRRSSVASSSRAA